MDKKKYPTLYYDVENMDLDVLGSIAKQLSTLYQEDNLRCIFLPLTIKQEWLSKEDILTQLKEMIKEVESWE